MDRSEMKKMLGMSEGGQTFYKLDKVTMSGDTGEFTLTDLTSERQKGEKPEATPLGKTVEGIILKMRWVLQRWDEPSTTFYNSTEYDDKWKDTVTVYPTKDKGDVVGMKEKHQLKTLRVIYIYEVNIKKIVRLYVKASALSGKDKNENGELGLFEYLAEFGNDEALPCQYHTIFQGLHRKGKNENGTPNKRKDHYAMFFTRGEEIEDGHFADIQKMMLEVDTNTKTLVTIEESQSEDETEDADEHAEGTKEPLDTIMDEPKDAINPDDIPF